MISETWSRERRFAVPRLLPRRLRSLHTLALVLAVVLVGWLGWLWYRSSSFVKVDSVKVTGLSGPNVPQIREALTAAALQMTTLNIDLQKLETAVSQYPYVRTLTVSGRGAHGVMIHVAEQVPVAYVRTGGRSQIVDADGALLPSDTTVDGALPVVPVSSVSAGNTVTAPGARAAIAVLAAAPYALIAHVASATASSVHGTIVQLRSGPQLYFGSSTQLAQKWASAVAVLQNKESVGASYIDVSDPSRPAAGVGVTQSQAAAAGLSSGGAGAAGSNASPVAGSTVTNPGTSSPAGTSSSGVTAAANSPSSGG